ncbi:ABC transporter permease [Castellaniella sp. FW104-16D08]|jgi:NitT/TauT family transport system permease protein|uniref:ABC transporter permease n=1 Tax=unclassified Castellaniella TaxID=2617606 RepID=UPI0033145B85
MKRGTTNLSARQRLAFSTGGLLVLGLLWAAGIGILGQDLAMARLFSPGQALPSLAHLVLDNQLTVHALVSLKRVAVGLFWALLVGIPLGLAIGLSRRLESSTTGAFQFLRMVSPLSWMPIAVMLFGVGDAPIYFLLSFAAVWPIILNTSAGVRQLDARWLMLARSLSATRGEILRKIILPGAMGHILTGLRLAIGIVWIILVPCEMLGVSSGLGYFILDTRDRLAYSELMAVIVLIGALGFALDATAQRLHRHWTRSR